MTTENDLFISFQSLDSQHTAFFSSLNSADSANCMTFPQLSFIPHWCITVPNTWSNMLVLLVCDLTYDWHKSTCLGLSLMYNLYMCVEDEEADIITGLYSFICVQWEVDIIVITLTICSCCSRLSVSCLQSLS